jgi:hypothetical protein
MARVFFLPDRKFVISAILPPDNVDTLICIANISDEDEAFRDLLDGSDLVVPTCKAGR